MTGTDDSGTRGACPLPPDSAATVLERERDSAETAAWNSLARYKFMMFGYWCGIWVHLNRLCIEPKPNPWRKLVQTARQHQDHAEQAERHGP